MCDFKFADRIKEPFSYYQLKNTSFRRLGATVVPTLVPVARGASRRSRALEPAPRKAPTSVTPLSSPEVSTPSTEKDITPSHTSVEMVDVNGAEDSPAIDSKTEPKSVDFQSAAQSALFALVAVFEVATETPIPPSPTSCPVPGFPIMNGAGDVSAFFAHNSSDSDASSVSTPSLPCLEPLRDEPVADVPAVSPKKNNQKTRPGFFRRLVQRLFVCKSF